MDLLGGLTFKEDARIQVPPTEHINLRELQAVGLVLRRVAAQGTLEAKVLVAIGSLAAQGVVNKGRSASRRLNAAWRRWAPYLLGSGLTVGTYYVPTWLNPADAPSRGRPVPPPTWGLPPWYAPLDNAAMDYALADPKMQRAEFLWWRIPAALVARRGQAAHRDFDATLGFPGAGPRPRAGSAPARKRPCVILSTATAHTPVVQRRRQLFWARFSAWHSAHYQQPAVVLAQASARQAAARLAVYGQWLYDRGRSLLEFSEVINSMVDIAPAWRRELNAAWAVAWAWKGVTDAHNHVPCPALVVQAFAGALLEARRPVQAQALALLVGFAALLRPIELARLTMHDVVLPEELGVDTNALFIRIRNPKMRRLAARLEHARPRRPAGPSGVCAPREGPLAAGRGVLRVVPRLSRRLARALRGLRGSREESPWTHAGLA